MFEYLYAYLAGAFIWALVMSLLGDKVDWMYLLSMAIWPVQLVSVTGQIIRQMTGRRPFK